MPENSQKLIWTVSEINSYIKDLFAQNIQPFTLQGEISNLTIHSSGHVYFSLKDNRSQISAVLWRGRSEALRLQLKDGVQVEAEGTVSVYEPRGTYQFIANNISVCGDGSAKQKIELLKKKLANEGCFDPSKKRAIPRLPRHVGVVSSIEGAALKDFMNVVSRRFKNLKITIAPAAVQGRNAVAEVVNAIRILNENTDCDVIVVTRGGGSEEDLMAFNEEEIARAILASEIPIISAIGHEIDTSISDLVADLRAPTPSAAAELVVGNHADLLSALQQRKQRLQVCLRNIILHKKNELKQYENHYILRNPYEIVREKQQYIDDISDDLYSASQDYFEKKYNYLHKMNLKLQGLNPVNKAAIQRQKINHLSQRIAQAIETNLSKYRKEIVSFETQLNHLSPNNILTRGYSIATNKKGEVLKSISQVTDGEIINTKLADGVIHSIVNK